MNAIVPWAEIVSVVEPFYPNLKNHPESGRPAYNLGTMLRIYFLQNRFGDLSDPDTEEAFYSLFFEFAETDQQKSDPDETTICKFRRLFEKHRLNQRIFEKVNHILEEKKLVLREGTIVDATIISAPRSTKNAERKRDPEMSSTKKGNHRYHGMKSHIGPDAQSDLTHSLVCTSANVHDITAANQ